MNSSVRTDAELVAETLSGNRDAFAEIVRRYQTLICSLAFSATGDVARSEDLAQETFLAAWRQLRDLREPAGLRGWLCGIARHRIQDSIRGQYRQPTHQAEDLASAREFSAEGDLPSDAAMRKDEAALVWRALEQIPEIYREPLVLFHRENQSVAEVAAALELTEDAVKQRLSRGRTLLQTQVEAVVAGALRRTAPGSVFTTSVMAALPVNVAAVGKMAAGMTAATAKGVFAGIPGILAALATSPLPAVAVVLLERKRMRTFEATLPTWDERELLAAHRKSVTRLLIAAGVGLGVVTPWYKRLDHPVWFAPLIVAAIVLPLIAAVAAQVIGTRLVLFRIWTNRGSAPVKRGWEWRTTTQLLGRPLVHFRVGFNPAWTGADQPVRAWIAAGHIAYGRLFAVGAVAIAPISCGAIAIGIVSAGAFALGGLALGALLSVGGIAIGAVAVGWISAGAIALAAHAATGFNAYAWTFGVCPPGHQRWAAFARHANDAEARAYLANHPLFSWMNSLFQGDRRMATILFVAALPYVGWSCFEAMFKGTRKPSA